MSASPQQQHDSTASYITIMTEVNQIRLTMVPAPTTVSGVVRNKLVTSFYMVPTKIALQTTVPVAQQDGAQSHTVSPVIIIVAVCVPLVVLSLICLVLFVVYRKRRQRRTVGNGASPYPVLDQGDNISYANAVTDMSSIASPFHPVASPGAPPGSANQFRSEKVARTLADSQFATSSGSSSYRPPSPPAPPNYETALSRAPSVSERSYYSTSASSGARLLRRPSRRSDVQYPTVEQFLEYISALPGGKPRNLSQYAPTFNAQDYYTIDELRTLTQAQLCEAIPGLTRGNGDYICQMVKAELLRIEGFEDPGNGMI